MPADQQAGQAGQTCQTSQTDSQPASMRVPKQPYHLASKHATPSWGALWLAMLVPDRNGCPRCTDPPSYFVTDAAECLLGNPLAMLCDTALPCTDEKQPCGSEPRTA